MNNLIFTSRLRNALQNEFLILLFFSKTGFISKFIQEYTFLLNNKIVYQFTYKYAT